MPQKEGTTGTKSPYRITNRQICSPRVWCRISAVHVSFEKSNPVDRTTPYGDHPTALIPVNGPDSFLSFWLFAYFYHLSTTLIPSPHCRCYFLKVMHIRKKSKLYSPTMKDLRQLSIHSVDSSKISLVKTKGVRRRRMKLPPVNYACRRKIHFSVSGSSGEDFAGDRDQGEARKQVEIIGARDLKITVLSFSSSAASENNGNSNNGGVVLPSLGSETRERNVSDGLVSERGSYGVVSVIGRRSEMEDAVRAEVGFAAGRSERYDFFGVYDGHGGAHVANTCRERLHEVVAAEIEGSAAIGNNHDGNNNNNGNYCNDEELEWEKVMEGCFGKMDEEVRGNAAARTVGATAVVAVVAEDEVVVANCGDCRAVLSRAGLPLALSTDHKPERPDELERIEAAGGRVINWNGHRVLGVLATSRSIGDQYLRPFIISKPEVTVTKRTENDDFLILASDGLWDVLSNEVACKVVKKCLEGQIRRRSFSKEIANNVDHESRTSEAAAVLAELAMARGSRDNISVIVVDLRKT